MYMLKSIMVIILILLSVAFFTFFERKILGYMHNRLGPNKVGFMGVLQPFSDAMKLFMKEDFKMLSVNFYLYMCSPMYGLLMMLLLWLMFFYWGNISYYKYSFLMFFCISSMSIYFLLLSGWASGSKYSYLGSYRSSSQAISYEVSMVLVFILICFTTGEYSFSSLSMVSMLSMNIYLYAMLFICWFITCLAECNRSPFDFSEGESELVSGFNTEFGGGFFSMIFIGEYSSILFLSMLSSLMFFNMYMYTFFYGIFISFFYLWIRASFPRLRYDKLMMMCWKGVLVYIFGGFIVFLYILYM